ncbi:hypothetical protein ACXR2U_03780 [Jatrophihabitans sp. YIM 134969]
MTATLVSEPPVAPHRRVSVPLARRVAAAGGLWAWAFAAVHGYWAAGGRVGVPDGVADIARRPAFLAYDLAACVVFALAGVVGFLLSTPTGGGRRRLFLVHLALVGGVAGLLRGGLGLLQDVTDAMSGGDVAPVGALADGWFVIAGAVFVVAAWQLRETARIVTRRRW